jgi:hypothetical protein
MYIRWQSRKRQTSQWGRYFDGDTHWRAILVESVRQNGKPTQKHIAYLAGFAESAITKPYQQMYIWERIEEKLRKLGNRISSEEGKHIAAILSEKLGKPPAKEERAAMYRDMGENYGWEYVPEEYRPRAARS